MLALDVKKLSKDYHTGKAVINAVKDISFSVKQGDFFALLGPNGAGKSTTIGIISSLVNKTNGKVFIHGVDTDDNWPLAKSYLGLVPQELNFNQFEKVEDILLCQAGFYGIPRNEAIKNSEKYLKQLGLWNKRHSPALSLSGGMKRRVMIARALMHNPKLLILDEPTAGVDIELRRTLWDFILEINQQQNTTIILTTHYLEEAENLCKNIAIINHGEIVTNTDLKSFLRQLDKEKFLLFTRNIIYDDLNLNGFNYNIVDSHTIEVEVNKAASLNPIFAELAKNNIEVISMKNKSNRLEELFVSLTSSNSNLT